MQLGVSYPSSCSFPLHKPQSYGWCSQVYELHLMVSKQYQAAGCRAVSDGTERWLCVLMKGAGVHGRFTDHGRQRFPPEMVRYEQSVQPWHQVFSHVHSLHCSCKTVGVQRASCNAVGLLTRGYSGVTRTRLLQTIVLAYPYWFPLRCSR